MAHLFEPDKITYIEYSRRIFNEAVLYSLCQLNRQILGLPLMEAAEAKSIINGEDPHYQILNGDTATDLDPAGVPAKADAMAKKFFSDELNLDKSTVKTTKKKLHEACRFLGEMADAAEEIGLEKAKDAEEEKIDILDDQKPELSPEDKGVLNQIFSSKNPTDQISEIRDATVKALMAEEEKAKEVKDAVDMSKSKVASGEDPQAFEETVRRIDAIGPTSLLGAIMNSVSAIAVKDISESGRFSDIPTIMKENRSLIKDRSMMIYALYETANHMGIHRYTPSEVRDLAAKIYYGR